MIFNQSKVLQFGLIACYILSKNDVECVFILIDPSSGQDVDCNTPVSANETTDTNITPWINDSVSL